MSLSKTVSVKEQASGPAVLRFEAKLLPHPDTKKAGEQLRLRFPDWVSQLFPAEGAAQVEGTIGGQPFRAALDPAPAGGHLLRVNKAMAGGAKASVGDTVELAILGPEPEPTVPADLKAAMSSSDPAKELWKDLTPECRRDYIRWIELAKKEETRARRVTRTVEQLAEGKRRPCCVDFYEYMLGRVREV